MKKKTKIEYFCKNCKQKESKHILGAICNIPNKRLDLCEPETNLEVLARLCKRK